jgi:hypothetical protein
MGYYVKSKKINITLSEAQQNEVFNIWMNPSEELKQNNSGIAILSPVFNAEHAIHNPYKCTNVKEILDMIGIDYEEKKDGLKLKSHHAKWGHQKDLFSAIAPVITPGNFMTLRGEDGELIGFFFNGKDLIEYSSYDELEKLETPFKLKKDLDKNLSKKDKVTKVKVKM